MGQITLQTVHSTIGTHVSTTNPTDADIARMVAALRYYFDMPAATNAEVLNQWAKFLWKHTQRIVREAEDHQRNAQQGADINI